MNASVDLVQENGPERLGFKQKLYGQLDLLLPPDVIIASSSSRLAVSQIQLGAASHPERCVIGHRFNPPHLHIFLTNSSASNGAAFSARRGLQPRHPMAGR